MQQKRAEIKDSPQRAMKIKDTQCNYTWNVIARTFVGLVFLFSSFVKGVDPMGTAFKMEEYMGAWSGSLISFEWFVQFAKPLAMVLITCEFLVGVLMLTGAFRRLGAWLLAAMMLFFTCTTAMDAFSATYGINDCGCFGDALVLTNWQTFYKNVFLLILDILLLIGNRYVISLMSDRMAWLALIITVTLIGHFMLSNIRDLPIFDFRPYKVGTDLRKSVLGGRDSRYVDFSLMDAEMEDVTGYVLSAGGYTFLLVAPYLENASQENIDRINDLYYYFYRWNSAVLYRNFRTVFGKSLYRK